MTGLTDSFDFPLFTPMGWARYRSFALLGVLGKIATNEVAADSMSLRLLVSSPPKANNKAANGGSMMWSYVTYD